jgi:organic hydroperoxide reductase OsmC/OhrA
MMGKEHCYRITTTWTGNLGSGTSGYRSYSRSHEFSGKSKNAVIHGSSDPVFRGDSARYSPEELLVASLAACHMLWMLHLCADAGIVIVDYTDEATGTMIETEDGGGRFIRVTLHPHMTISDAARVEEAKSLHTRAHELCFIAQSVNFPVDHQATVSVSPP